MLSVKLNKQLFDRNFDHFVDSFLTEFPSVFKHDFNETVAKGSAPVNVKETEQNYRMEIIAPGFEKNDFKISLEKDLLTIAAAREREDEIKEAGDKTAENGKVVRQEYSYRSFKRTFTLDEKIDATKIDASYINGVLILNLPKKAEVKVSAKAIEIK